VEEIFCFKKPMLDGSNFSDIRTDTLPMKEERLLMFQEEEMKKTRTFTCGNNITV
jgi:hypothetical protein